MSSYAREDPVIKNHLKIDKKLAQSATVGETLDWAGEIGEKELDNDGVLSRVVNPFSQVFQWKLLSR